MLPYGFSVVVLKPSLEAQIAIAILMLDAAVVALASRNLSKSNFIHLYSALVV